MNENYRPLTLLGLLALVFDHVAVIRRLPTSTTSSSPSGVWGADATDFVKAFLGNVAVVRNEGKAL